MGRIIKYDKEKDSLKDYDDKFKRIMGEKIPNYIKEQDNDFKLLVLGKTGSGKSNFMLHAYDCYDPVNNNINFVALKIKDLAISIDKARKLPKTFKRFVGFDEADVQSRNAMAQQNKDLISLYSKVRGFNIFHIWCWPSAMTMDKTFIKENIDAVVVVKASGTYKRKYFYFTTRQFIKMCDVHKTYEIDKILTHSKAWSVYTGWFKMYKGHLLKAYHDLKKDNMDKVVDEFKKKYADNDKFNIKQADLAKIFHVTPTTIGNKVKKLIKENLLFEDEDYTKTLSGHLMFSESVVNKLQQLML